jgi:predicted RNase H-like nuclease
VAGVLPVGYIGRGRGGRAPRELEREVMSKRTKFVFVTGGVVSSIGKGSGPRRSAR